MLPQTRLWSWKGTNASPRNAVMIRKGGARKASDSGSQADGIVPRSRRATTRPIMHTDCRTRHA
eukprot:5443256-Alexandrium_andersonii.AAC.1